MKATFAKALVLALALALVLSGCNLVETNWAKKADDEIAKIDEDYTAVVATYGTDGTVTVAEAASDFNAAYSQMYYMYAYFGMTMDHEQVHELIESTLEQRVRAELAAAHYDEGHELSQEELDSIAESARESEAANLDAMRDSAEGESEEERAENVRVLLRANGMDYDTLYEAGVCQAKADAMEQLLRDDVEELTDEELQDAYDAKLAEQKESFTDGSSFESAMTGEDEIVCWIPDGYRTVKHILLTPSDEVMEAYSSSVSALESAQSNRDALQAELDAANDDTAEEGERAPEEIQAELDAAEDGLPALESDVDSAAQACLDDVKETSDEIYRRLEAGDSFEDLIAEYGQDPGMQSEPTMSRGYYVSDASTNWEANFRDAAMALEQVGDYSLTPVVSGSGVHIIQYTGDVAGGEVPLDEVRDELYAEALEEAKQDHATETIDAWVEEAASSIDAETFEQVFTGT